MLDIITIKLLPESDDAYLERDILAVSHDVVAACAQIIGVVPPLGAKPYVVQESPDGLPRACLNGLPSEYQINVTCLRSRQYDRLAFQLGHELGHCHIGPHFSNYFIESVCTAISFLCLDALADKWATTPLCSNWQTYASKFAEYRREMVLGYLKKYGIVDRRDIPIWIHTSVTGLVTTEQFDRPAEALCADVIADIMRLHARSCSVVTKLGEASQDCGKTDFTVWRSSASSEEVDLVDALNLLFEHES